jgi:hypothetical protein
MRRKTKREKSEYIAASGTTIQAKKAHSVRESLTVCTLWVLIAIALLLFVFAAVHSWFLWLIKGMGSTDTNGYSLASNQETSKHGSVTLIVWPTASYRQSSGGSHRSKV